MSQKPLDPLIQGAIQQVTEDKVANGEMFTAFDVSRTVQNLGHRERHTHMKHVVHDLFESGQLNGYSRTLIAVEQGKPEAWVYHPLNADPKTYTPSHQPLPSGMTPQAFYQGSAPTPPPQTPSISTVSFVPPMNGKHKPDARGAITVPAKYIKQIGGKPNDVLYVERNGSQLVIATSGTGRPYTVNTSTNIRIKRKTWGGIVSSGGSDFEFEEKAGKIVVTHK